MSKRNFLIIILVLIALILGVGGLGFFSNSKEEKEAEKIVMLDFSANDTEDCPIVVEKRMVRGNSLAPIVKNGETITALFGYYECNEVKRNDMVLYSYAGNENPLMKIIRGVSGDSFRLEETGRGTWHILINDEILKNSEGAPYLISGKKYEMLALYERSYGGKIPQSAFLLLGNVPSGTIDSTQFGLIGKTDILGKAEY